MYQIFGNEFDLYRAHCFLSNFLNAEKEKILDVSILHMR